MRPAGTSEGEHATISQSHSVTSEQLWVGIKAAAGNATSERVYHPGKYQASQGTAFHGSERHCISGAPMKAAALLCSNEGSSVMGSVQNGERVHDLPCHGPRVP